MLNSKNEAVVNNSLIMGFESSGKTTLFSRLSGKETGDEINVKGSTILTQKTLFTNGYLIDTPGINNTNSTEQSILAKEINEASTIILVVRGTHFVEELEKLYHYIEKVTKGIILFVTFSDKMSPKGKLLLVNQITKNKLPIFIVDSRKLDENNIKLFIECLIEGDSIKNKQLRELINLPIENVEPPSLFFEKGDFSNFFALVSLVAMFLIPVMLAYLFSNLIQPVIDKYILNQITALFRGTPRIIQEIFIGNYGLLTLGINSFIWAFPVVLLISCSKAITEESGIKDRIVDTIEPTLKKIGLTGRDILPIITGFGCNVVAVFQSRGCHTCNRSKCVSFISFGSACSYQIGATLSVFNAAHAAWLFFPYLLLLLIGGIIQNKIWFKEEQIFSEYNYVRKAFIQKPNIKTINHQIKGDLTQFFKQAMPIFMIICIIASLLQYIHVISFLSIIFQPILYLLNLPVEGATALVFSFIRKDGILILNEGNGDLLSLLSNFQLFLLVFLASTLSSCIVTLSTVWKELGLLQATKLIYRQLIISLLLGFILAIGNNVVHFF